MEVPKYRRSRRLLISVAAVGLVGLTAACGSSNKHSSSTTASTSPSSPTTSASSPTTAAASASVPAGLSVSSFNSTFSIMPQFRGLTAAGKGMVGVILPDTTSSTRYVDFDAPYLSKAFQLAGYTSSQYKISNAQGSESAQLSLAQADISEGATVLLVDQLSTPAGNEIVSLAAQHGVKVIAYDRAIFTGTNTYYVSFDNLQVGKLIGTGFNSCVASWGVSHPQVFELSGGEDIDANAVSFADGYNSEIWGKQSTPLPAGTTNASGWHLVGEQITPGWVNATGGTIFQQQFTAHPTVNATVEANDGLANAVITDLKNRGVGPKKIPTTGQDATLQGMENVLTNYQCGSVYKPVYKEAQDAVSMATIIRAGQSPSALINGQTAPPKNTQGTTQPASLLTPTWVTTTNMNDTVIKDKFIQPAPLCAAVGNSVCTAAGITS